MRPWLFVYGSLMPGRHAHNLIVDEVMDGKQAHTPGQLYESPFGFPAMKLPKGPTTDAVFGYVYRVKPEVLQATYTKLDEYEGHPHLFERLTVQVVLEDGTALLASTYVGKQDVLFESECLDGWWKK